MAEFKAAAGSLGLKCLVEVHDSEELKRAQYIGAEILGVNNRNLKTFEVSLSTSEKLFAEIEDMNNKVIVSESGIKTAADLKYLQSIGADAALIGETFMRESSVSGAVSKIRGY